MLLSLQSRRRIFARKKRHPGAAFAVRSFAVLAFGLAATVGAAMVAEKHPLGQAATEQALPAVSDLAPLPPKDPVMRLAAASPDTAGTSDAGRDAGRRAQRSQP